MERKVLPALARFPGIPWTDFMTSCRREKHLGTGGGRSDLRWGASESGAQPKVLAGTAMRGNRQGAFSRRRDPSFLDRGATQLSHVLLTSSSGETTAAISFSQLFLISLVDNLVSTFKNPTKNSKCVGYPRHKEHSSLRIINTK